MNSPEQSAEDKVWASAEITVNLGNYENVKIMAGYSKTLVPGEDPHQIHKTMIRKIVKDIQEEGEEFRENCK